MSQTNHDIRALVEKEEERFAKLYPDIETHGKGRRSTIRSMAIRSVADTLQVEVSTVRKKYQRAGVEPRRVRKEERERFDYLGVQVTEAYRRMLMNIHGSIGTVSYALSAAKANLTKLAAKYPVPAPLHQRILIAVDEAMQVLRSAKPIGLCPWCKNVNGLRDSCTTCHGSGYLTEAKRNIVPEVLRSPNVGMREGKLSQLDSSDQAQVPDTEPAPPPTDDPW